jgi:hypothetical protein
MYELNTSILATVRKINETPWAIMFDARNSGIDISCLDGAARIINLGPAIPWYSMLSGAHTGELAGFRNTGSVDLAESR